jgi:glycerophosphoryl diester phosphodiesterase
MRLNKIHISLLIILSVFISCNKEEKKDYSNIEIYGHGGAGFESHNRRLPSNSFKSIQKAIEVLNADGVEVDLQMDSNGTLWLFHDQFLEGKTNGNGCFGEKSTAYIKTCNYNLGGKIYQFQELINYLSKMTPKPKISLQIQLFNRCINYELLTQQIIKIIKKNNAYSWIQIESDSPELLESLKSASQHFQLYVGGVTDLSSSIELCLDKSYDGVIISNDNVSISDINKIKSFDLKIGLFDIDNQSEIKSALEKQPHQIQCDNIELTHRIMSK